MAEIISSFTSDYKPNTPQMSSIPFIQCYALQKPPEDWEISSQFVQSRFSSPKKSDVQDIAVKFPKSDNNPTQPTKSTTRQNCV